MKPSQIFLYALTVIFLLIIIFLPSLGWRLRTFLSPMPASDQNSLMIENQALQAQIAQYATVASALPTIPQAYVPAIVYSEYPTNVRSELLLNAGSNEGVAVGKPVLIEATSSFILIGKVLSVFGDTSVIETVFDPNFKLPVRIGTKAYDGLLLGGSYPRVVSIQKNAAVEPGDVVSSADVSLPYGLPVAQIAGVNLSSDSLFQEASLQFAYDVNAVKAVLIGR